MTNRYCFHADESFVNRMNREFQVVRITENEPGYTPVSENPSLEFCVDTAKAMNREHGLSDEDVINIRMSSMRAHNTQAAAHTPVDDRLCQEAGNHIPSTRHSLDECPVENPAPEIRIVVTDMDGTVIEMIECTKDDLRNEVRSNPHGLLSDVNFTLIGE